MKIKLESLNGEMFEKFKENEFSNLSKCIGGYPTSSTWTSPDGSSGTDTVETSTMDTSPARDTTILTTVRPALAEG